MIYTVTPNPVLDRTLFVEQLILDGIARAVAVRVDYGGKGINVSRVLHALGLKSIATGFVGGATGAALLSGLKSLGIENDFLHIAGETRTNIVVMDRTNAHYIKVNAPGPWVGAAEIGLLKEKVVQSAVAGSTWVLSGSLPPGAPGELYADLIALLKQHSARTVLDSSGEPLRCGFMARPYLVKPNAAEAEELSGLKIDNRRAALENASFFIEQGVELVALSMGADGLLLANANRAVWATPPRVSVKSIVGAGDALLAGLVWGIEKGLTFDQLAAWGVATGAAATTAEGVSLVNPADIQRIFEQVRIDELDG